jgi:phage terminase large subunit-like protein
VVRELWAIVGRRGGKDSIASAVAAFAAATFNQQNKLRPGERAVVMCLAVDRDQARVILNYIRSYFTDVPLLAGMLTRETATGFELNNGIDIAIVTNNFRSIRGRAVLLAIFDECAFYRDESSSAPDEEMYKAITPALASIPGSMIIGISSPYRKAGLLYKKYKKHFGQNDDVLVIQASTRSLNPTISQDLIDRELADDPAGADAEWMANFRNDIGG